MDRIINERCAVLLICLEGCENEVRNSLLEKSLNFDKDAAITVLPKCKFGDGAITINQSWHFQGPSGMGRLILKTVAIPSIVLDARNIQFGLAFIDEINDLSIERESGLFQICKIVESINWKNAIHTWSRFCNYLHNIESQCNLESSIPKNFCVRSIREGKHHFNSLEISQNLGSAISAKFGWPVSLKSPDCEVIVIIQNEICTVGLNLFPHRSFLNNKIPPETHLLPQSIYSRKFPSAYTSLKPSVANSLLELLHPRPGEVFLDYMCGLGTAVVEAALSFGLIAIGGDGDLANHEPMHLFLDTLPSMRAKTRTPAGPPAASPIAEMALWSLRRIPLRDATVDLCLVSVPFGRGNSKRLAKPNRVRIFTQVEELARLLRPGGRALFVLQADQQLRSCLDSIYFQEPTVRGTNIGGCVCTIVIVERSTVSFLGNTDKNLPDSEKEDVMDSKSLKRRCESEEG